MRFPQYAHAEPVVRPLEGEAGAFREAEADKPGTRFLSLHLPPYP